MKRFAVGTACSVLFWCLIASSIAAQEVYTGEIIDSNCAKIGSHAVMLKKGAVGDMDANDVRAKHFCMTNCVHRIGAKYVLYTPQGVRQLDDQTKASQFAGQNVTVTGTLDRASKIHVTDIKENSSFDENPKRREDFPGLSNRLNFAQLK